MKRQLLAVLLCVVLTTVSHAQEDHFFAQRISHVEWSGGNEPPLRLIGPWDLVDRPYVVVPGGEAYLVHLGRHPLPNAELEANPPRRELNDNDAWLVAVRSPKKEVTGTLYSPRELRDGGEPYSFSIAEPSDGDAARQIFYHAKRAHYADHAMAGLPGAAWFRHQVRTAEEQLPDSTPEVMGTGFRRFFGTRVNSPEDTFALISGGRAVSENLQLDQPLPEIISADDETRPEEASGENARGQTAERVPIESLTGITVREFDWERLNRGIRAEPDPLARFIPGDQHGVFFPSFDALVRFADHSVDLGTPVLQAGVARAEDARTRERYEQQLGLSLDTSTRIFGGSLIRSIAITGGDLYLRSGSDVALLFEPRDVAALLAALEAQIAARCGNSETADRVEGEYAGVPFRGYVSPDRRISSYVARIDDVLIVTNSLVQLERIAACAADPSKSLAELPEYTYFRHRYPRNASDETAFAVLSDATIRRWCGPKWRIAASRRIRAAAVMAELQAQYLSAFVAGTVQPHEATANFPISDATKFLVNADGLRSEQYGDLEFQTPIMEMELTHVTPAEAEQYRQWVRGYERNWSTAFDPIAIRFGIADQKIMADLTVMPLINNSQYRGLESLTRGAKLTPLSGDPHPEAIFSASVAFDPASQQVRRGANSLAAVLGVDPLSWVGNSITFYVDDDPVWQDIAQFLETRKSTQQLRPEELAPYMHRLPVAVHFEVSSVLKTVAFLASFRAFVEQTAPGLTVWETRKVGEQSYVRIAPSLDGRRSIGDVLPEQLALYYTASGDGLTVTLSENVIRRVLERRAARQKNAEAEPADSQTPDTESADTDVLLGESVMVDVDARVVKMLATVMADEYQRFMQEIAWSNLPILNEWHRQFPMQDPVELHQAQWGVRLRCPGGGEYRWNERLQTMESTVYGCPAEPRKGPPLPETLAELSRGKFGLTFEENGLRARVELHK